MLKYVVKSDNVKVGITEMQGRLEKYRKIGISVRQQAMNKNCQKKLDFSAGSVCGASLARWNAQLKGLVELEKRCRNTRQEMQASSERQDIF